MTDVDVMGRIDALMDDLNYEEHEGLLELGFHVKALLRNRMELIERLESIVRYVEFLGDAAPLNIAPEKDALALAKELNGE